MFTLVIREIGRFKDRCIWSWHGVVEIWKNESSFRSWAIVNFFSVALALILDLTGGERALILSLGLLILAAEFINSAIERTVDYISEEQHPLAKAAKDAGSAGVAMTAFAGGVAWLCILIG